MVLFIYVFIFVLGLILGFVFKGWLSRRKAVGTIHVIKEDTRTLYSLELEDYPESLAFHKVVLFKVDTSKESLDRE